MCARNASERSALTSCHPNKDVVMSATHCISASHNLPLVPRPPSALQNHQRGAAACSERGEDAGIKARREIKREKCK